MKKSLKKWFNFFIIKLVNNRKKLIYNYCNYKSLLKISHLQEDCQLQLFLYPTEWIFTMAYEDRVRYEREISVSHLDATESRMLWWKKWRRRVGIEMLPRVPVRVAIGGHMTLGI